MKTQILDNHNNNNKGLLYNRLSCTQKWYVIDITITNSIFSKVKRQQKTDYKLLHKRIS